MKIQDSHGDDRTSVVISICDSRPVIGLYFKERIIVLKIFKAERGFYFSTKRFREMGRMFDGNAKKFNFIHNFINLSNSKNLIRVYYLSSNLF